MPRALAPLRHGSFRLLVSGQLTSNLGDAFYAVALPWYVLSAHGGPLVLGSVLAAYGISRTLLLAVGGQASDRWRPWTVMMGADAVRAVAVGALAVAALTGPPNAYILIPISVVIGAGEGLFLPGSYAIVPSLLPDAELEAGNAITTGGTQLATLIGPAIGGAVVALAGATPAFATDAASFAISALTLWGIRLRGVAVHLTDAQLTAVQEDDGTNPPPAAAEPPTPAPTLRHLLATERVLQVIIIVLVAANLGAGGMGEVALPALARGPFGAGAGGYGALLAAHGGGALLGTLAAGQARRARRPAVIASAGFLVEAACLALVPYLGGTIPAAAALLAFGALNGFGTIILLTAFQRWAPPAVLGRLMAVLLLAAVGVFPVSVFVAGLLVDHLGPAPFFPLAGALLAVAIAVSLSQRSWRDFGSAVNARRDEAEPAHAAVAAPGPPPAPST
jgi:predicted MFS family arabinose efflux permease